MSFVNKNIMIVLIDRCITRLEFVGKSTVESRYNEVKYNMTLDITLQWLG